MGGHCIGVDPYYLTNAAEKLGYHSQIILNGRKVNDSMGAFVADAAIKQMIEAGMAPKKATVVILGITFKENCPDTRNSKVVDIINPVSYTHLDVYKRQFMGSPKMLLQKPSWEPGNMTLPGHGTNAT